MDRQSIQNLFTSRVAQYQRFIRAVHYPRGLQSFFEHSPLLRPGLRVLDAGCGTGAVTLGLREALARQALRPGALHAFDLTPAMLTRFRQAIPAMAGFDVETQQADVLRLETLPESWTGYDLIVTASMLEYIPRDQLPLALGALRTRLHRDGYLLAFVTKRNWLMHVLVGRWWRSNLYSRRELAEAFEQAGFTEISFEYFPATAWHLRLWGHVVQARTR